MVLPRFTMVLLGFTIVLLQDVQYLHRCQVSPQRNRSARRENHGRLMGFHPFFNGILQQK